MKSPATNLKMDGQSAPIANAIPESVASLDNPERSEHIATSAYYMAEERGFAPGHELDDWLTAETKMNTPGDKS